MRLSLSLLAVAIGLTACPADPVEPTADIAEEVLADTAGADADATATPDADADVAADAEVDATPDAEPDGSGDAADTADAGDGAGDADADADAEPEIVISVEGDTCDDAIIIPPNALPFVYQGESSFAGNDYELGGGCQTGGSIGTGAPDVVFSFTPATGGWHIVGMAPVAQIGNNPSALYVTTDCGAIADNCVGVSSDLTAGGFFSVFLEADTTYFFVADGLLAEDAGAFTFTVDESVCVPNCPGAGECGRDLCGGFCGAGCDQETTACHPEQGLCLPPNDVPADNCVGSPLIEQLPATINGDTYYGSNDYHTDGCAGEPNPVGDASRDHIYTLQPTVTGKYTFTLTSEFDGVIYVTTSCNVPESFCVGAADATTHTEILEVTLEAGATYFVFVDGASNNFDQYGVYSLFIDAPCVPNCNGKECGTDGCGGSCGTCTAGNVCGGFGQCQKAPQGDHCLNPYTVGSLPFVDDNDSSLFQNDHFYADGQCGGVEYGWGAASNDVVYEFTAPTDDDYTFKVEAGFDTTLYVATDCNDIGGSCMVSADSPTGLSGEVIDMPMTAGQTVLVVMDGYGNISNPNGPYSFSIDYACSPDCSGKECGDDGCGGTCGECLPSETCSPEGTCGEPLGNSCNNPFVIDDVPFVASGDTSDASPVHGYPYDGCGEDDIYARGVTSSDEVYQFTPTVTGVYDIRVEADFSASWYVVSDCTYFTNDCFTLQEAGPLQWAKLNGECVFDEYPCAGTATEVTDPSSPEAPVLLEAGTTYFIIVDGQANNDNDSGTYTLTISDVCLQQCDGKECGPDSCGLTCGECQLGLVCGDTQLCDIQVGNTCQDPFVVPSDAVLPWTASDSTADATNVYGVPKNSCPDQDKSFGIGGNDHVYAFTPQTDGKYEITLDADFLSAVYVLTECAGYPSDCFYVEAEGYNTWIALVQGCSFPPAESVCFAAKGDKDAVKEHVAKPELVAGTTYYIVVDGATSIGNLFGNYTLTIDEACTPQCDDKECGDDGCGETCGTCPGGFTCTTDGQCVDLTSTTGNSCADPYVIEPSALPFLGTGDTSNDSDVYSPCGFGADDANTRDEVWRFTPDTTGVYVISVNASFNAALYLGTECVDVDYTCVESTTSETISETLTAGTEYFIFIDGAGPGQEGDYSLEVKQP